MVCCNPETQGPHGPSPRSQGCPSGLPTSPLVTVCYVPGDGVYCLSESKWHLEEDKDV